MFTDLFPSDDQVPPWPALVEPHGELAWPDFRARIAEAVASLGDVEGRRIGLVLAPSPTSLVPFFALLQSGAHLFLMASDASPEHIQEWAQDFGLSTVIDASGRELSLTDVESRSGHARAITILTSGTTGKPKAVEHTWQGLSRPVRRSRAGQGARWLLTFRPHLYAGLQVMLQCLLNQGTLVMPPADGDADAVVNLAAQAGVEFASATPSYWRWLLTFAGDRLGQIPLKQITLGGEAVDQATLDALHANFPQARLVHIYATTELGRCFSVTDGLAGFPRRFLDDVSGDGVQMRIEDDGELVVRSANAMSGYDGGSPSPHTEWFHTGDLVQPQGDRVHFVGRMTDMINVGGNKVYPMEIEELVRSVPGVADARVYGEPSSIVGELVKCDVVIRDGYDPQLVEAEIRKRSLESLSSYQRPRFLAIVDEIPRTAAGKVKR